MMRLTGHKIFLKSHLNFEENLAFELTKWDSFTLALGLVNLSKRDKKNIQYIFDFYCLL